MSQTTAQDLFIDYGKQPLLAQLASDFHALVAARQTVADCLRQVKELKGSRIPERHQDDALRIEREHAYEVGFIRLELASEDLIVAIRALMKTSEAVSAEIGEYAGASNKATFSYREDPIARNNVVCSRRLIEEATTLYFRVSVYPEERSTTTSYHFAINRLFKTPKDTGRHFVVTYGGGGGHPEFDPCEHKEGPFMTEAEANHSAGGWESIACTIGGSARVYDLQKIEAQSS
ncbi:MAG: hypothetical protein K8F91_11395 [Candidatus Obscuribacterales bacterium]|nr:hypothetical protein [Candidatus Obscuribacterales bacterium]